MQKVATSAVLKKKADGSYDLFVQGKKMFVNKIKEAFGRGDNEVALTFECGRMTSMKTDRQLRAYFGAVLPQMVMGYVNLGYRFMNKKRMDYLLRSKFFVEELANDVDGDILQIPKSLSDASKEEVSDFIDKCIQHGVEDVGINIMVGYEEEKYE